MASVCFESFGMAHGRHEQSLLVTYRNHVHGPCPLQTMYFLLMHTTGLVEFINSTVSFSVLDGRSASTDARCAWGMCYGALVLKRFCHRNSILPKTLALKKRVYCGTATEKYYSA